MFYVIRKYRLKWRRGLSVLCDKKVLLKLKGKFYRTTVRPTMLYGTECWAVKSQHENQVSVTEMRRMRRIQTWFMIADILIRPWSMLIHNKKPND